MCIYRFLACLNRPNNHNPFQLSYSHSDLHPVSHIPPKLCHQSSPLLTPTSTEYPQSIPFSPSYLPTDQQPQLCHQLSPLFTLCRHPQTTPIVSPVISPLFPWSRHNPNCVTSFHPLSLPNTHNPIVFAYPPHHIPPLHLQTPSVTLFSPHSTLISNHPTFIVSAIAPP